MIAQSASSSRARGGSAASDRPAPATPLFAEVSPPPSAAPALAPLEEGAGRVPWKVVYTIIERGRGRRVWLRVGVAFVNRDQSLNVRLDAVPISGQLHIREAPPPGSRDSEQLAPLSGAESDRAGL